MCYRDQSLPVSSSVVVLLCSALVCSVFIACNAGDNSEPATRAECTQVREHGATLRMADVRKNSKLSEAELQKHAEGFASASEAYVDSCIKKRSHDWANCMLKLESLDGAKGCETEERKE